VDIVPKRLKDLYQKLSKPTQENNELWFSLYNLLQQGQVKYYDKNPETYIKEGYVTNPHVYATINKITQPLSMVPFQVYEVVDEKLLTKSMQAKDNNELVMSKLFASKALKPLDGDMMGLNKMFKKPNECQTWAEFVQENVGFKLLLGNSFTYGLEPVMGQRPEGGQEARFFSKLYNLPAQFVEIITGDWQQPIKAYKLLTNSRVTFEASKVLHRKYWNPDYSSEGSFSFAHTLSSLTGGATSGDNYYGMSPLSPLCRVVKRSNDAYTASMRMLENGIPAGILSRVGKGLNSTERDGLEKAYQKRFGGSNNKNKILFASTEMKWQSLGMNSVDMQLLDSNQADLKDIARVYRVPLPLLTSEASTMDNMNVASKSLWHDAIIPELNDLRSSLNMFLVEGWEAQTGKKLFIDYDLSGIAVMQANIKEQSERLLKEMEKGIWTPNEVRNALGGDVIDDDSFMDSRLLSNSLKIESRDKAVMEGVSVVLNMPISAEGKTNLLIEEYGFTQEQAETILRPAGAKNNTLEILKSLSPLLANKLVEQLSPEEIRALLNT